MQKKVKDFLEENHMIERGDTVVAGLSGGADSVCLVLLLKQLQEEVDFTLVAVHVEHGIRGAESRRDAAFARTLCEREQILFLMYEVDAPGYAKVTHQTLEEAARELRYQCFEKACESCGADKIAVAHHADDCAETMLFHLSRGTGIRGLCGITPVRERIIRPLLIVTRKEIEQYLEARSQEYCTDSTNLDTAYTRNRIRHKVLPELTAINARAVEHMVRTAGYLEDVCDYLEEAAWEAGKESICEIREDDGQIKEIQIRKDKFVDLHPVLQKNLIHQLLGTMAGSRKDITARHMQSVLALFAQQVGKWINLPYQLQAKRTYDGITIRKTDTMGKNDEKSGVSQTVHTVQAVALPTPGEWICPDGSRITTRVFPFYGNFQEIPEKTYTKWFDYDKIKSTVFVRNRRPGDYLQTVRTGGKKKLKDFLIDAKIPQEERDKLLLLADESHILWIIGYRISEFYKVTEQTKRVLEICVDGGNEYE